MRCRGTLASHYASLAILGWQPPRELMPQAQAWAQKALEIDPSLQDAHAVLGTKAFLFDYDWNEAERRLSLAVSRDPVPGVAWGGYTLYKSALGRAGEAEKLVRREVEADPLTPINRFYLALILATSGRTQEAEREFNYVLELDENFPIGWGGLGDLHFRRGETSEAIRCYERAYSLAPFDKRRVGPFAGLLAHMGDKRRAEELLAKLGPPETYGVPASWVAFHLYQGETEKAVDWWEKLIDQRDPAAVLWPRYLAGGALRTSPRWPALAKRMNLPESAW